MELFAHIPHQHVNWQKMTAYKEMHLTLNKVIYWYVGAALFCYQWSRGSNWDQLHSKTLPGYLVQNLVSSARRLRLGHIWTFQQDNGPKHTSKSTYCCRNKKKFNVLRWLSQSRDFNPVESRWPELKRAVPKCKQKDLDFFAGRSGPRSFQKCSPSLSDITM